MSRLLSDIDRLEHLMPGREVLSIEIIKSDAPEDDGPSMIIYLPGMKLYVDNVSAYSDDSGDAYEAF